MSGLLLWKTLRDTKGGLNEAREFLLSLGYDGVRLTNGDEANPAYVAWTQEAVGKNKPLSRYAKGVKLEPGGANALQGDVKRGTGTGEDGRVGGAAGEPLDVAPGLLPVSGKAGIAERAGTIQEITPVDSLASGPKARITSEEVAKPKPPNPFTPKQVVDLPRAETVTGPPSTPEVVPAKSKNPFGKKKVTPNPPEKNGVIEKAQAPQQAKDLAEAMYGEKSVEEDPRAVAKTRIGEMFPGEENRALRHELYQTEGLLDSSPTDDQIKEAADSVQIKNLTYRKGELGSLSIGDMADAFKDMYHKVVPDKPEVDPTLTKGQLIQKVREASKKRSLPIDLNKVDMNKGINRVLAYAHTLLGGAGIDTNGVPLVGAGIFPSDAPAIPERDATRFERLMSGIDNPAAVVEGGIDTLMNEPLSAMGTSYVSEAAFANMRKSLLQDTLGTWRDTLLAPFVDRAKEVDAAIKPIFTRSRKLRDQQVALEKQLGSIPKVRGLEKQKSQIDTLLAQQQHNQVNDIAPPRGVENEEQANTRKERMARREEKIKKLTAEKVKVDKDLAEATAQMPKSIETPDREKRWNEIKDKLEIERNNLAKTTEALGRKYARVRIAVAVERGASRQDYPTWLKDTIRPEEQRASEIVRKFFDEQALPALKAQGVPVRENENFIHQPTARYLSADEQPRPVPKKTFREDVLDPDTIRFSHKEDEALLWVPEIGTILDSYSKVFPNILAKKELANRWDPALTEMRGQGRERIAGMAEKFLNNYAHGKEAIPVVDALTNWFYFKNLALNPSPMLLHAVKQVLNPSAVGPLATLKGYKDITEARFGKSEEARLMRETERMWRSAQGSNKIMEAESGVEPTTRAAKAVYRKGAGVLVGKTEVFDRNLTFMSALEFAKQEGLPDEKALQVAMGTTLAVNFLGVDRAAIYRGSIGRAAFAFSGSLTKITEYARRRAMETGRAGVQAARSGFKEGFEARHGSYRLLPAKGESGKNYRRLQYAAVAAMTYAIIHELDKALDTERLEEGVFHLGKVYSIVAGLVTGDRGKMKGAVADLTPAITQMADNIDRYGRFGGVASSALPTIVDKALVAAHGHGAPTKKPGSKMWGKKPLERTTRYFLNTPKASEKKKLDKMYEKKDEKKQNSAWLKWKKERGSK